MPIHSEARCIHCSMCVQFKSEMVGVVHDCAKFKYECGNYTDASEYLYFYRVLVCCWFFFVCLFVIRLVLLLSVLSSLGSSWSRKLDECRMGTSLQCHLSAGLGHCS